MKAREAYMRCSVAPGPFFPEEYAIEIAMGEDRIAQAWVWKSNVVDITGKVEREKFSDDELVAWWQGTLPRHPTAQGWARVIVMEEKPDGLLVTLPYDTMSGRRTFNVSRELVKDNPV